MKKSVCVCAYMYISRPMTEFWPQNEDECVRMCMHVHQQTYDRVLTTKWRRVCVYVHTCTSADLWQEFWPQNEEECVCMCIHVHQQTYDKSFDHKTKTSVCICACMYISRPMTEFWPQNEDECVRMCMHVHQQTYDRVLTTKWRRVCAYVHACTSADLWQSFDHKMKTSVCVGACM